MNAVVARADLMAAVGVFGGLGLLMGVALPRAKPGEAQGSSDRGGEGSSPFPNLLAPVGLTCALCLFALLSKEIGVALLFTALLWWLWGRYVLGETERPPLRNTLIAVCALALVLIIYVWMRYAALGMLARPYPPSKLDNVLALMPAGGRILGAIGVLGRYFKLLVWPWPLSMDYSFAQIPLEGAEAVLWIMVGALGFLAWSYAAWRLRKDMPWVAFGLVVFIGAYLPVSNLLIPMGTIMAERGALYPLGRFSHRPGAYGVCDAQWKRLDESPPRCSSACACSFGAHTMKRNHEWGDALRFWQRTAEVSPNSARALRVYGQATDRPEQVPGGR